MYSLSQPAVFLMLLVTSSCSSRLAPVCDDSFPWTQVSDDLIPCSSSTYTSQIRVRATVYHFHSRTASLGACVCRAWKLRQFCKSNILWSTDRWDSLEEVEPSLEVCRMSCRTAFQQKSSVVKPYINQLDCPWWATATNTTGYYTAILTSVKYHPLRNLMSLEGEERHECRLSGDHCRLTPLTILVFDRSSIKAGCDYRVDLRDGLLREDGDHSSTLQMLYHEEIVTFTDPCVTSICQVSGVLSTEGYLVGAEVFRSALPNCNLNVAKGTASRLVAHSEFLQSSLIQEVNRRKFELCLVAATLIKTIVNLGRKPPGVLLTLLNSGGQGTYVSRFHNGVWEIKSCSQGSLHNYTRLCPDVWAATTENGVFYSSGRTDYLQTVKPKCRDEDLATTLPGGYTVIQVGDSFQAILGSTSHHLYLDQLSSGELDFPSEAKSGGEVTGLPSSSVYGFDTLGPSFAIWMKLHPFLIGLAVSVSVITGLCFLLCLCKAQGYCVSRKPTPHRPCPSLDRVGLDRSDPPMYLL
ncbi:TPA_asm: hypothetical protein [Sphaeridiorhabdovirus 1]|nr:TPA_asm: hypothetical protein [Sphaeridiorhabdovirus 1]